MEVTGSGRLRNLLAELLVIVVGVLIALAADAAWDDYTEGRREADVLADLLTEFRDHETRLSADIQTNELAHAAALQYGAVLRGELVITGDSLTRLVDRSQRGARFDPRTGTLSSLLDGGELALIGDPELRRALAGWGDRVDEARATNEAMSNNRRVILPLLAEIERHRSPSPFEIGVLALDANSATFGVAQLRTLLEDTRGIVARLEALVDD